MICEDVDVSAMRMRTRGAEIEQQIFTGYKLFNSSKSCIFDLLLMRHLQRVEHSFDSLQHRLNTSRIILLDFKIELPAL